MKARFLLVVVTLFVYSSPAKAERYVAGKHVVHTRLAPVVVHRVFPPYGLGVHVYAGRNNRR